MISDIERAKQRAREVRERERELNRSALKNSLKNKKRLNGNSKAKEERKRKALESLWEMIRIYFSHHTGGAKEETSKFRKFVQSKEFNQLEGDYLIVVSTAGRGTGKTSTISVFRHIWKILRGEWDYSNIIGATEDSAVDILDVISTEFEFNEQLREDFEIEKGDSWTDTFIDGKIGLFEFAVQVFGYGSKRIRGNHWRMKRPKGVSCDDMENDENIETSAQREKMFKWFKRVVLGLPDPVKKESFTVFIQGTLLHHDSLLQKLSRRQDTYTLDFPTLRKFPDRMEEWRELYGLKDKKRAKNIYKSNRAFYDKGAELDNLQLSLFELIFEYFEDPTTFLQERNNIVKVEGSPVSDYQEWETLPDDLIYFFGIDPATGKQHGDYYGISIVGKSESTGRKFAILNRGYRVSPLKLINKIVELNRQYNPISITIESNTFQSVYADIMQRDSGFSLPLLKVNAHKNKQVRIQALGTHLEAKNLLLSPYEDMLKTEINGYGKPKATDDILDSLAYAMLGAEKGEKSADMDAVNRATKSYLEIFRKLKEIK
jgi:hypothetical protein